jgi:hypothetical protein
MSRTFGGKFHVTPFPPWDDNVERTEAFKFALQRSCAHSGTSGHIPAMRVYAAHYAAGEKRAILMRNSLDRRIGHGSKYSRSKERKTAKTPRFCILGTVGCMKSRRIETFSLILRRNPWQPFP